MNKLFLFSALLFASAARSAEPAPGAVLHTPDGALLQIERKGAWAAGFSYEREQRKLNISHQPRDLGAVRLKASLSYLPLPWAVLFAGAGAASADLDGMNGDYGPDWRAGARFGILEHVMDRSPVRGKAQFLRLDAAVDYRHARSDFSGNDLSWREWRFLPSVTYLETFDHHLGYRLLHPDSAALSAGLVVSRIKGKTAGEDIREHRNFGLRLAADVRLTNGWNVFADTVAYHASETSLTVGLTRRL